MRTTATIYYNLTDQDKIRIVEMYYSNTSLTFKEMSSILNVSERAFSRVLKDNNINTHIKNRYTLNEDFFEVIDTEEKAYWLGFIYADGYVGDEHFNNIVLSSIDKDHLEKFANSISYTGEIRKVNRKGGFQTSARSYVINFSSPKMAHDLRLLGLYPGKSDTIEHPPRISKELIHHFIRGYFDGDGAIGCYNNPTVVKGKRYVYKKPNFNMIGTEPFLKELEKYFPAKMHYEKSKSDHMVYIKSSGKKPVYAVMSYLYNNSTIYLTRKYNKWLEIAPLCRNA